MKEFLECLLAKKQKNYPDMAKVVARFCLIPTSTKLIGMEDTCKDTTNAEKNDYPCFPSVQVHNVIALPGVPTFCEQSFRRVERLIFHDVEPFLMRNLYLRKSEAHLLLKLNEMVAKHQGVTIGSYPSLGNGCFKTKLSVESDSRTLGEAAVAELSSTFKGKVVIVDYSIWIAL